MVQIGFATNNNDMNKIAQIRNIIAKTVLTLIGTVLMLSIFWGYILQGFNLNTSPVKEWSSTDTILLIVGFVLMVGAAYYNKILDFIVSALDRFFKR